MNRFIPYHVSNLFPFCLECETRELKCGTRGSYTRKKRATNEDSTPRITDVILTS